MSAVQLIRYVGLFLIKNTRPCITFKTVFCVHTRLLFKKFPNLDKFVDQLTVSRLSSLSAEKIDSSFKSEYRRIYGVE
jgi:hypothetical protein